VVFCETEEDALDVRDRVLPAWLANAGCLSPREDAYRSPVGRVRLPGFQRQTLPVPADLASGYKLRITRARKRFSQGREIRDIWLGFARAQCQGCPLEAQSDHSGLGRLLPEVVASKTFGKAGQMDCFTDRFVSRGTPTQEVMEVDVQTYWGKLDDKRDDNWVFGDKQSGKYLLKFGWFKIVRHELVTRRIVPRRPGITDYWWERQKVNANHLSAGTSTWPTTRLGLPTLWHGPHQR